MKRKMSAPKNPPIKSPVTKTVIPKKPGFNKIKKMAFPKV